MTLREEFEKETGRIEPEYSIYDGIEYENWQYEYCQWLEKRIDNLESALTPYRWTSDQDKAWHINLPDVYKAFEELRNVSIKKETP